MKSSLAASNAGPATDALATTGALPRKSPTLGLARHEVQQAVLGNLRQIAAAREHYRTKNGSAPESVHALVGRKSMIKAIRTVGGEDYSQLSMADDGPLTVETPDGIAVTFDPAGVLTTKPELPPELARVQELQNKWKPATDKALAAFRAANPGKQPANQQALVPYFATPQEGADFVEFIEAQRAAGGP